MSKLGIPNITKLEESVRLSLEEDIGLGDITGELIDPNLSQKASLICREESILCGSKWFDTAFTLLDPSIQIEWHAQEGSLLEAGKEVASLTGNAKCMVASERTALNFLQMMSGIAYKTHCFQKELVDSETVLLDTRKTIPGLRYEQKYSVVIGGGQNHRMGLYDAALIKENHISSAGSIKLAVSSLKEKGIKTIEVEVESLEELQQAIDAQADIAMLDNFAESDLEIASEISKGKIKLEISGNIGIENLNAIKKYKIDYISSGDLTKNISATDYSLIFRPID
jgi:nicotinate-nucleotide pyrophosphorylase (carboxylating)|tara:strand:- start:4993 stop:5841 length:849 start_codon:yes stop_codon:yes gene_type:complete